MQIEKVKYSLGGYLITEKNGSVTSIPSDSESSRYKEIQKWIAAGGVIEKEFFDSELKTKRTESIKLEAAKRISDAYPEWQQTNYMASVSEIHNKEIVAMKTIPFVAQYQLTAEELQTLKAADTCKKFITAIRVKSNSLEKSLDAMTSAELEAFDPARDSHWQ